MATLGKLLEDLDFDEVLRTSKPIDEAEVERILTNKWRTGVALQSIVTDEQRERLNEILRKKWFFQGPLSGFPLEEPAGVVKDFMTKQYYSRLNFFDDLQKQEDALNRLMVDDEDRFIEAIAGRRVIEVKDETEEDSVLSPEQEEKLKELLKDEEQADWKYIEEHPEIEGIVGFLFSNLCYYRPLDAREFTEKLFSSSESCIREHIESYLNYKNKRDPVSDSASAVAITDWREVIKRQVENEKVREEEEQYERYLNAGNEDELMVAYGKVMKKKNKRMCGEIIDDLLDRVRENAEAVEEEEKRRVVAEVVEYVMSEVFVTGLRAWERSERICEGIVEAVLSGVYGESREELIAFIVEMVVDAAFRGIDDVEMLKEMEENKERMIAQIFDTVFNNIFGVQVKLEDRLTDTEFDIIIRAIDKVMNKQVEKSE
uniref:Uncharacterized protein n=1 Tax=Clastoptera arizonana TaxID=38151 RepID=A0A1B6CI77_9HEMI